MTAVNVYPLNKQTRTPLNRFVRRWNRFQIIKIDVIKNSNRRIYRLSYSRRRRRRRSRRDSLQNVTDRSSRFVTSCQRILNDFVDFRSIKTILWISNTTCDSRCTRLPVLFDFCVRIILWSNGIGTQTDSEINVVFDRSQSVLEFQKKKHSSFLCS